MLGSIIGAIGGAFGAKRAAASQREQLDYAKELNRNKIRWTVEDAKAAGISPLAALGSPSAGAWATPQGQSASGSHIADAARQLGAGVDAHFAKKAGKERMTLENDLIREQIRNARATTYATIANAQRPYFGSTPVSQTGRSHGVSADGRFKERLTVTKYTNPDGSEVYIPSADDPGEVLMGGITLGLGKLGRRYGREKMTSVPYQKGMETYREKHVPYRKKHGSLRY